MTGEPDVVELTFAAALSAHDPTETGRHALRHTRSRFKDAWCGLGA